MALLISNCPRCGTENITFDVAGKHLRCTRYSWQPWFEVFCICRKCHRSTVFLIIDRHKKIREADANEGLDK